MTCKICGYHKVCQSEGCKHGKVEVGTRGSGIPLIGTNAIGHGNTKECPHCHGTGYCPKNNE
jgi:hypothetical protein